MARRRQEGGRGTRQGEREDPEEVGERKSGEEVGREGMMQGKEMESSCCSDSSSLYVLGPM